MQQEQFLNVLDRDEAERRFRTALELRPLESERTPLAAAHGRVLAEDVVAPLDVPGFDRSNVDGFAVQSADTFGATEDHARSLFLIEEVLATGVMPTKPAAPQSATAVATGAIVPRGADAVVMIEHTDIVDGRLIVRRPVAPGANITFAGTDIGRGETVLRRGEVLTSRETGVLAALGLTHVLVVRRPRVAILSTGDEIIPPGAEVRPGLVYDSNATVLADAVREQGGEPIPLGIVPDDADALRQALDRALDFDMILLSGGTSKGPGDVSYRVVSELAPPGIIAHGVALKPGKPLCLAAVRRPDRERVIPVAVLPGFPTSAIFTFHEFIAPVIRRLAGCREPAGAIVSARLPMRINSERGRTEYVLVNLVSHETGSGYIAYPLGKGSGSVTTFSKADGFLVIPRQREYLEAGAEVEVQLLSQALQPADLIVIGSHCVGLDYLLGRLQDRGYRTKFLAVGSTGGLMAAQRGECDVAGVHLFDPKTKTYNQPFLNDGQLLVQGYGRLQGIVFRPGDTRFEGRSAADAVAAALADPDCVLANRNRGSGTRILIDQLLGNAKPPGFFSEARSHNAVAAAVQQGRADWGVAIEPVARDTGLGLVPLQPERYDFIVPRARSQRPAVRAFCDLLREQETRQHLATLGFDA